MIVWKDENLTLFRSALYETISSVITTEDCVIVVDPCWLPHEVEEIKQYVNEVKGSRPLYLLFTHSDFDHIIGYQAFPEAKVIASDAFDKKAFKDKEDIIEQIKAFDDEYYVTRNDEIVYPEVDHAIAGEETSFSIGKTKLTFYQAPGHNDDGIMTVVEPLGILVAGDYLSDIEFPYIYFSSYEYEKTLLKLDDILEHYPIKLLVTGHGTPTRDHAEMQKRQQDSLKYIHKMRKFVQEENEEGMNQLIAGCKFPRNMRKFHEKNKKLFKQEWSG
ncbi:MBL fold metallo-hydrolase [Bacillus sp. B15-48]|uniref:MBL fold metallo-hydrolase n=1 Tax=Bacillus sp. B15-48 TaxID=1548601 RepID=UPI00193F1722|nr:MBL fold metallo-hydrolase [Bacillus sp. B15-48]MBM4763023.1 MBL fold metallo-hydrolase [Bacillus sp. B15-48]